MEISTQKYDSKASSNLTHNNVNESPRSESEQVVPAGSTNAGRPSTNAITRKGVLTAALLVFVGSVGIQLSSFAASKTFADLGTPAASSGRMFIAALVLLVLFRPKIKGLSKTEWVGVVVYGGSMALMNLTLFAAVERIPLGIAVTIEFLGPCAVALIASRKLWEGVCAVLALLGVVLIAGPSGDVNLTGVLFAFAAALCFALYTVAAEKVGKSEGGMGNLALAVAFAALVLLPFGLNKLSVMTPEHLKWLTISALCGAVLGYGMDTMAARVTSSRVIGTLFAIDPMTGSVIGWLVMGQLISPLSIIGIVLVSSAGALLVWISGSHSAPEVTHID